MIINTISKITTDDRAKIECWIEVETTRQKNLIWLDVDKKYEKYLCTERADAFIILLIPLAMKLKENIISHVPITEDILYGLERDLIPALVANNEGFQSIKIIAEGKEALENEGKVGTGCSCGIDSLYAIKRNLNTGYENFDITHLCVFNNRVHNDINQKIFRDIAKKVCGEVCLEIGLPVVVCDSNCMNMLPIPVDCNFLNTYAILFFVFSLQKLFGRYYLGSTGSGYKAFSLKDADKEDCAYYDLLTLSVCSTNKLKLVSAHGAFTRYEKTKEIADWSIAQKYLNVCNEIEGNCGICWKCRGTLMNMEALGKIDKFQMVFDTSEFKKNRKENYYWLYKRHCVGDDYNEETYQVLKNSPLMKEAIAEDKIWENLSFARGLYDDGWIQRKMYARSKKTVNASKMFLKIYISNLTPENKICIYVNEQLKIEKEVIEGIHELEIEVPNGEEISWEIELEKSVVPKEKNLSEDIRDLGCILMEINFL